MKMKMDVYLKGLSKEIKRTIHVNERISLKDFCEFIIVSMNGNCKHLYQLVLNDIYTFLGDGCDKYYDDEEMIKDKTLEDLDLHYKDELLLNYDFRCNWDFIIKIKSIEDGCFEKDFEIKSGCGCGIIEDCFGARVLKEIIHSGEDKEYYQMFNEESKEYDVNNFNIEEFNLKIENYLEKYRELTKPKRYEMYIYLEGFEKEIKRKISVDSNVKLYDFCKSIIYSMKGDVSHPFCIKNGKEYIDYDEINAYVSDLNNFELTKGKRLKLIYDFGDNWVFNIRVAKVIEGYGNKRFEVLSGKGYGIIDDCGGIYGLDEIFTGKNTDCGKYDINDFDLDKINKTIDFNF